MTDAILTSLPIAFGIVISTLPGLAIPLILLTRREMKVLRAFLAGYLGGFFILGGVVILLSDVFAPQSEEPALWNFWLRIVLGIVLLWLALRKWQGRAAPNEEFEMPGWMQRIDTIRASRAALLGFALVVLNPKNSVLVITGALSIATATHVPIKQAGALIVFTLVSTIGLALPCIMWLVLGEKAMGPVDRLKSFLARNNAIIMTAVLAAMGLIVITNAF